MNEELDDFLDDEEEEIPIEEVIGIGSRSHPSQLKKVIADYDDTFVKLKRLTNKYIVYMRRGDYERADEVMYKDMIEVINEQVELQLKIERARETEDAGDIEESEAEDVGVESPTTFQQSIQPIRRVAQEEEHDEIDELAVVLGLDEEE